MTSHNNGGIFGSCGSCLPSSASQSRPQRSGSSQDCCGSKCWESSNCCNEKDEQRITIKLPTDQQAVRVPKTYEQEVRILPEYLQGALHDVPTLSKPIEPGIMEGIDKPAAEYFSDQQIFGVEAPQIRYVDIPAEKEVVIDTLHEWKEKPEGTPVYKYAPQYGAESEYPSVTIAYSGVTHAAGPSPYSGDLWGYQPAGAQAVQYQGPHYEMPQYQVDQYQMPSYQVGQYEASQYQMPQYTMAPQGAQGPPLPSQYQALQEEGQQQLHKVQIPNKDFSEWFSRSHTKDYTLGEPGTYPAVTPLPSPQIGPVRSPSRVYSASEGPPPSAQKEKGKLKKKKWWFWPFFKEAPSECCKEREKDTEKEKKPSFEIDPLTGYPKNMPSDFAQYFQKAAEEERLKKQKSAEDARRAASGGVGAAARSPSGLPPGCDLEPVVEYKGAINKSPEYGGSLQPISFKLHAIEVHQFIPLPNVETPPFVKMMPSAADTASAEKQHIEQLFGPVSSGWADPVITGMPAPMMNDIMQGTLQPNAPLFQQISMCADAEKLRGRSDSDLGVYRQTTSIPDVVREAQEAEHQQKLLEEDK